MIKKKDQPNLSDVALRVKTIREKNLGSSPDVSKKPSL